MTVAHLFEDFGKTVAGAGPLRLLTDDALEDLRLGSFEKGYSAGWEDAEKARSSEEGQASDVLKQSLEDLSFTFHEVRAQMFSSLEPLFECVTQSVLPDISALGVRQQIASLLTSTATDLIEHSATLFVAPGEKGQFEDLLMQPLPMPLQLAEDACLAKEQVILRLGSSETAMDRDALIVAVRDLINAFLFDAQQDVQHG